MAAALGLWVAAFGVGACGGARAPEGSGPRGPSNAAPADAAAVTALLESPSSCPAPPADRAIVSGTVTDERSGAGSPG